MRLTSAARGNGSVAAEIPSAKTDVFKQLGVLTGVITCSSVLYPHFLYTCSFTNMIFVYKSKQDPPGKCCQGLPLPAGSLGTSTPVAAKIFSICCSTLAKFAAGLGQSDPFMETGFHRPLVTSEEK